MNAGSVYVRRPVMKEAINTNMEQSPSTTSGNYCNYNSLPWQQNNVQSLNDYQSLKRSPRNPHPEYLIPHMQAPQPAVMMLSTCQSCSSPTLFS
uniref:Uncharacterized protein n=1 Tax=Ditylenchus dipsaci TaxID=166011 RepID=A0A915DUR2_9BILA